MEQLLNSAGLQARKPSIWRKVCLIFITLLLAVTIFGYFVIPNFGKNGDDTSQWTTLGLPLQTNPTPSPTPYSVSVPVLMYHYVRIVENPEQDQLGVSLSVTPENFEKQMAYLYENGFSTITPDTLWAAINKQTTLPTKPILLTFDDGYSDFYDQAWPVLNKYNLKSTVFVVTGFLDDDQKRYLTWAQVKELDQTGLITIGSHTINHINTAESPNAQREITLSKKQLETYLGHSINSFAYPGGTFNIKAAQLVGSAGFNLAFTTVEGRRHGLDQRLTLPRVRISGGMDQAIFINRINGIY